VSRLVGTEHVVLEVVGVTPHRNAVTRFNPHVMVTADEGPFVFTVGLTPDETRSLIEALQGELARIGGDDE